MLAGERKLEGQLHLRPIRLVVISAGWRSLYIDDDRILDIDQVIEAIAELDALVGFCGPRRTWMVRGFPVVGDIVMTTEGPLGEVARLDKQTVKFALAQRVVRMRGKRGVLDNGFLKFLLMSPIQQATLSSYATGTTVAGISQKSLRSVPISIPPYHEQVAIGELLGALDNKIDLNRRMNETLETMARAIFKDWFVDFGPTRAKIEGSAPYFAPEIWALFPDRLDDEEKPEGWAEKSLDQIAEFLQVMADSPGWAATWVVLATAIPPAYRASGTDKAITDYTRLAGEMTNLRDRFRHAATIDSYKSFAEFDAATKPLLDRS